jgi:hypothetical protein
LHACILLIIHHCVPPSDYNWWVVMISLTAVGYGVDRAISVRAEAQESWKFEEEGRGRPFQSQTFHCRVWNSDA